MNKKIALLLLGLLFFSSKLVAQTTPALSTQELVNLCQAPGTPENRSFCIGYSTAIYDTYLVTRHPVKAKPFICVKQPAPPIDTVISEFVNWANQNSQYLKMPAPDTAMRFLAQRFPCSGK
jgi:hypothetical protein